MQIGSRISGLVRWVAEAKTGQEHLPASDPTVMITGTHAQRVAIDRAHPQRIYRRNRNGWEELTAKIGER